MVVWSPFRFNSGREMANRFAIAPLTTDSSHEDGTATENGLEFVRRRAASDGDRPHRSSGSCGGRAERRDRATALTEDISCEKIHGYSCRGGSTSA